MTGMEHAIEQVAQRLHSSYCECEGWHAECQGPHAGDRRVARRLAAEGLLAPAPLTEVQAKAWDEGYRAGSQNMSDLRAGRLTFQMITGNPYGQEADR